MTERWKPDWHHLPLALFLLTIVVIAVGGTIRIHDAGESCPDWPTCFGTWGFDVSEDEQGAWYAANPDEVDSRGSDHTYTTFQIFTEWFHRLIAGTLLGPLVLLQWYIVHRRRAPSVDAGEPTGEGLSPTAWRLAMLAALLVALQGAIGAVTVWMDNEHWSVALHLMMALAFAATLLRLWIVWLRDVEAGPCCLDVASGADGDAQRFAKQRLFEAAMTTMAVVLLGAFVSTTSGANTGCGVGGGHLNWPLCNGRIAQAIVDFEAQSQMIHRWLVVAVLVHLTILERSLPSRLSDMGASDASALSAKRWVQIGSGIYWTNLFIGMAYIFSWTEMDGFSEGLSLIHLMLGSLSVLALLLGSFLAQDHRLSIGDATNQGSMDGDVEAE